MTNEFSKSQIIEFLGQVSDDYFHDDTVIDLGNYRAFKTSQEYDDYLLSYVYELLDGRELAFLEPYIDWTKLLDDEKYNYSFIELEDYDAHEIVPDVDKDLLKKIARNFGANDHEIKKAFAVVLDPKDDQEDIEIENTKSISQKTLKK